MRQSPVSRKLMVTHNKCNVKENKADRDPLWSRWVKERIAGKPLFSNLLCNVLLMYLKFILRPNCAKKLSTDSIRMTGIMLQYFPCLETCMHYSLWTPTELCFKHKSELISPLEIWWDFLPKSLEMYSRPNSRKYGRLRREYSRQLALHYSSVTYDSRPINRTRHVCTKSRAYVQK